MEGVADGSADAKHIRGVEDVGVIDDVIVMHFRADEEISPEAVTDVGAEVH